MKTLEKIAARREEAARRLDILARYADAVAPYQGRALRGMADSAVEKLRDLQRQYETQWGGEATVCGGLPRCLKTIPTQRGGYQAIDRGTIDKAADDERKKIESLDAAAAAAGTPEGAAYIQAKAEYAAASTRLSAAVGPLAAVTLDRFAFPI